MDAKDSLIGMMLDNRYELLEKVGEGGMSIVYKARCHRLNRYVAVKILRPEFAKDEEFRRRFHAESQAVAMLSHPNIVAVYDVNRSQGIEYLVMELIDGITLKQYMSRKGQLNWREALHFVTQVVRALNHAHSRGIVHRDIKPHNVMVLRDGSVKVADFGIARLVAAKNTLTQEALGSVHYISPEQAKGGQVDARSDIYSAGVVLYEILTGRLPFEGENAVSVAIQHINAVPLNPRAIDPTIPEGLEEITMKAMTSDIGGRYQSADDMYRDLEEFRKNPAATFGYFAEKETDTEPVGEPTRKIPEVKPVPKRPPSKPATKSEPVRRKGRRSKAGAIAMVCSVLLVLAFVAVMMYFLWQVVSDIIFPPSNMVNVPTLTGLMYDDVKADPKYGDFDIVLSETGEYGIRPAGEIVDQKPPSGRPAERGSAITVTVSRGERTIVLEDYAGKEYRTAEIAISKQGLTLGEPIYDYSETVLKGNVIRTEPPADSFLGEGEKVSLVISDGPMVNQVIMPNLVGDNEVRAKERLTQFKLVYGGTTVEESDSEAGTVTWQSVPEGTKIPEGSVVAIRVSAGGDTSEPPPVSEAPPDDTTAPPPDTTTTTPPDDGDDDDDEPSVPATGVEPTRPSTISLRISLPSDRDTAVVRITVDGVEVFNQSVRTDQMVLTQPVSGTGSQQVNVYIDGTLVISEVRDF